MRWSVALTAAIAVVALTRPVSTHSDQVSLDLTKLLDTYAAGRFDEAVRPVAGATEDQARAIRAQLMTTGRLWIDAPGHAKADRLAVAATFALETEGIRVEQGDWAAPTDAYCAGACIIEWACSLFHERSETPDALEHDWFAASITLASGQRDWAFLYTPRLVAEPFGDSRGHVNHALARFPGDPRFRLARAQALGARFEVTYEQDQPREGVRLEVGASPMPSIVVRGPGGVSLNQPVTAAAARRATQRTLTLKEFADLAHDAAVGVSARTRLAYFHWASGHYDEALSEAQAAATQAADRDARYLARYIAGMAAQSSGALAKAESLFASALEARPHSQSASVALAALLFQRGDAAGAYALTEASLTKQKNDDDPWRLFQYADYPKLPSMIQALRRSLPSGGQ